MRLSEFLTEHTEEILVEWEAFARTLVPASAKLDVAGLRDFAKDMLVAISCDLEQPETAEERARKARGEVPSSYTQSAASEHGAIRARRGFTLEQMVSEFRALRASVIRLWTEFEPVVDRSHIDDLMRFNEAVDQALAESVARYRDDLERSKDMFLGILGHDLRNPLGAIMMSAGRLMANEEFEKTATLLLHSAQRMKKIIDDLLDFTRSRLGSGIPIHPVDMDMGAVCQETIAEIAASHPDTALRFQSSGQLTGRWDSARIGQAISNIIGNAVQHGAADAPVTITARGDDSGVVVSVHNDGRPITPGTLENLFTPMRRGAGDPNSSGSLGLGLYIAGAIVAGHNGHIGVESSAELGTTFIISLPQHSEPVTAGAPVVDAGERADAGDGGAPGSP